MLPGVMLKQERGQYKNRTKAEQAVSPEPY